MSGRQQTAELDPKQPVGALGIDQPCVAIDISLAAR